MCVCVDIYLLCRFVVSAINRDHVVHFKWSKIYKNNSKQEKKRKFFWMQKRNLGHLYSGEII